jgi:hypothetical protein
MPTLWHALEPGHCLVLAGNGPLPTRRKRAKASTDTDSSAPRILDRLRLEALDGVALGYVRRLRRERRLDCINPKIVMNVAAIVASCIRFRCFIP